MGFVAKAHYEESNFLVPIYLKVKKRFPIPYLLAEISLYFQELGPEAGKITQPMIFRGQVAVLCTFCSHVIWTIGFSLLIFHDIHVYCQEQI